MDHLCPEHRQRAVPATHEQLEQPKDKPKMEPDQATGQACRKGITGWLASYMQSGEPSGGREASYQQSSSSILLGDPDIIQDISGLG
jgi:hypothetical protein